MHMNSGTEAGFARHAEESILAELRNAPDPQPVPEPDLKTRVRKRVSGFSEQAYKAVLASLVAERKIHGRPKLSEKTGKPTKTMSYVFGAPPPLPTPTQAVTEALRTGALSTSALKAKVTARVPGLSAKDYNATLAALIAASEIHPRFKLGKVGLPTKTVESYALGAPPPPPPAPFVVPILTAWKKARDAAKKAGVSESALLSALLKELGVDQNGGAAPEQVTPGEARERVLLGVRELVKREGSGALIPIRQLRGLASLSKPDFDRALFELRDADRIVLHHHEYVGSLSDAERAELIVDRYGNHYMGVALRGEP